MKEFFLSEGGSNHYHSCELSTCKLDLDICWDFINMKDIDKVYMCTMSYYKPGSVVVQRAHDPIEQHANKTCTVLGPVLGHFLFNVYFSRHK